jgi:hypothetical protein
MRPTRGHAGEARGVTRRGVTRVRGLQVLDALHAGTPAVAMGGTAGEYILSDETRRGVR